MDNEAREIAEGPMTLREELDALDKAATQGEWRVTQAETRGRPYGQPFIMAYDEHGEILDRQMSGSGGARSWSSYVIENRFCADDEENNLLFIAALVNAYRTGQLVPLPEVEELAKVMCDCEALDPDEEVNWTFGLKRRKRWETSEFAGRATAIINHMKGKTDGQPRD